MLHSGHSVLIVVITGSKPWELISLDPHDGNSAGSWKMELKDHSNIKSRQVSKNSVHFLWIFEDSYSHILIEITEGSCDSEDPRESMHTAG